MARNNEKREKLEMYTVGPVIWQENRKMRKMRNSHDRTWNVARNHEKREK
jgi:hypothetical protein